VLAHADLYNADLSGANLDGADLTQARLDESDLSRASLIQTTMANCTLDHADVYGVAVWRPRGEPKSQKSLRISPPREPLLTLDRIDLAQLVDLLVQNAKLGNVISALSSKSVLILGRFSDARKPILELLSNQVRARDMLPIVFDWEPSESRDLTETVQILASICRFVIADITDARSVPQELSHIIPFFPSVPVQPLILSSQRPYAMFEHSRRFPSVLPEFGYDGEDHLKQSFEESVLKAVERWEKLGEHSRTGSHLLMNENRELRLEIERLRASVS
jgi:hypothetical protein